MFHFLLFFPRTIPFLLLLPLALASSCSSPPPAQGRPGPASTPTCLEDLLLPRGLLAFSRLAPSPRAEKLAQTLEVQKNPASSKAMEVWKKIKGLGEEGGPALARLLREGPPPVQMAAATLLGCLGEKALVPLCRALDDPDPEVGAAAAFALGDLGDPRAAPRLLLEVLPAPSPHAPVVRAAAASSLLELGSTSGVPFLLGLLQAGTPRNGPLAKAFFLPEKDRWALEKEIALRALRRFSGKRFGLEPEQGWKDLKAGAARWEEWWKNEGAGKAPALPPPAGKALEQAISRVKDGLPFLEGGEKKRARRWIETASRALGKRVE